MLANPSLCLLVTRLPLDVSLQLLVSTGVPSVLLEELQLLLDLQDILVVKGNEPLLALHDILRYLLLADKMVEHIRKLVHMKYFPAWRELFVDE